MDCAGGFESEGSESTGMKANPALLGTSPAKQ